MAQLRVAFVCLWVFTTLLGAARADDAASFFARGAIPRLRIEIAPGNVERLRQGNRPYVPAQVIENDTVVYRNVGVKIKGAAGSTRPWEDKPALTLNADKFSKGQKFHGMDKFHLNNSVQDDSYLNELISSDLFRAAGYPAARITHARVWLNGRDVGLYVLKEGFDKRFLKENFPDANGNLYDGGFVQDIDADLQRDEGSGDVTRADLKALVEACRLPNPIERWNKIAERLNVGAFLTFMAMERMACHWDGYCLNVNNYRVYFDTTGKAVFIPHGMDQMFGDINVSVLDNARGMVAAAILQNPTWRQQYRKQLQKLTSLFAPAVIQPRIDEVEARLRPVLNGINPDMARSQGERAEDLKRRVIERGKIVAGQLSVTEPPPPQLLRFDATGAAALTDWKKVSQVADTRQEVVDSPAGGRSLSIKVGSSGVCVASWRTTVVLGPGIYTFTAHCRTQDVVGLEDEPTSAAGIRLSGDTRTTKVEGTGEQNLVCEFAVQDESREVVLVAELRGAKGQVWFDAGSMRLTRKPDAPIQAGPVIKKPAPPVKKPGTKPTTTKKPVRRPARR